MTPNLRFLTIPLIVLCSFISSYSQVSHYCGTDQAVKALMKVNPNYAIEQEKLASFTKEFEISGKAKKGNIYIIPIVFHVIHNYGSENITEKQILEGLQIINEDFRKLNEDTSVIDSTFKGIAADCEIEFRLAQKDPDGNCTNGITRTASTQTYTADNGVKSLVRWPNDRYLNVWLVQSIASGAGGYAYYPGASPQIDGIVLRRTQFGIGHRSLTHEIGHYLNLPHLWGSTNDPELPDNCNSDDGVSDTPNTIGHTNCDIGAITCGSIDNVQNFMEYSFCDRMFTEGQKSRMHAALNASASNRNNLSTASNLLLTGTDGVDYLCSVDFSSDSKVLCEGRKVMCADKSYNGQNQYSFVFDGVTHNTSTEKEPLITYNTAGTYNVSLEVSKNGLNPISVNKSSYIIVQSLPGQGIPFSESFENFSFDSDEYRQIVNPDEGPSWEQVANAGYTGSSSLKIANISGNEIGRVDEIIGPVIDLSDLQTAELSFQVAFAQKIDTSADVLRVYVSPDCGDTWALRFVESNTDLATVPTQTSPFTPAGINQWQEFTLTNIDAFFLTEDFRFKFMFIYNGGNDFYLDDINISGESASVPMLVSPYNGAIDQPNSVTLDWNAVDSVDSYIVQIDTMNDFSSPAFLTWTNYYISTLDDMLDTEYFVDNLLGGSTTYYWRVRTMKDSVYSSWSAIWDFVTTSQVFIEGNTKNTGIKIYPNPITNETTISIFLDKEIAELSIVVFDVLGRRISEDKKYKILPGAYNEKIPKLNVSGIYFIKIEMDDQIFLEKIILGKS